MLGEGWETYKKKGDKKGDRNAIFFFFFLLPEREVSIFLKNINNQFLQNNLFQEKLTLQNPALIFFHEHVENTEF